MTHRLTESWLRAELAQLRNNYSVRGMTVRQVAEEADLHPRTIERIEVGPEPITAKSLEKLMHVYKLGSKARTRLRDMLEQANRVGWWDEWHDDDLSPAYIEHCELESIADGYDLYVATMFHGLLQCEEYAYWAQGLSPPSKMRQGEPADRMVQLRMARQQRFWERGSPLRLLVDEPVLLARRGPFTQQLDHLRSLEQQGRLSARMLPADADLAIPDTFGLFNVGDRKVLCSGVFVEHHVHHGLPVSKSQENFDMGWQQAMPLFT